MLIPDLPPDLTFPKLGSSKTDIDYAFDVKRAALGPHIIKSWEWDEAYQRKVHQDRYNEKTFFRIQSAEQLLGTIAFDRFTDHIRLGEFYLFPEFQGHGTGSRILKHCLKQAESLSLPVRLEYLKWNPVGSLYSRHGFVETGQSDIHYFMELPVN